MLLLLCYQNGYAVYLRWDIQTLMFCLRLVVSLAKWDVMVVKVVMARVKVVVVRLVVIF